MVHVESQAVYVPASPFTGVSFFDVVKAAMIKDLIVMKRYKANLLGSLIRSVIFVAVFWLFSRAYLFTSVQLGEHETLLFFISGFLLISFDGVALWKPLNAVSSDLYNGTLEYLYTSPNSRIAYFVGTIAAEGVLSLVFVVPPVLYFIITGSVTAKNLFYVLLVLILALIVLIAFGTMFALMVILWKQVNSIVGIISTLLTFLAGFLFPVSDLPYGLKYVAYLLPYTWGIDLLRYYTIPNWQLLVPLPMTWGILLIFAMVYWSITIVLASKVEAFAKSKGLHLL